VPSARRRAQDVPLMRSALPWVFMCSGRGSSGSHERGARRFRRESCACYRAPSAVRFHKRFHTRSENSAASGEPSTASFSPQPRGPQACSSPEFSFSPPPVTRRPAMSSRSPTAESLLLAPSLGFALPLRDVTDRRPCQRIPKPSSLSVPGVSHALDGFLRQPARGFVSPHCHVQGSALQGLHPHTAASSRRRRQPSRRCRRNATGVATSATSRRPGLRA